MYCCPNQSDFLFGKKENPNFDLIQFILNQSPELLFITDNRGFTALRYIPQSCWEPWCDFIEDSLSFLRLKINHSEFLSAHCQLDDAQERLHALMRRAASYAAEGGQNR